MKEDSAETPTPETTQDSRRTGGDDVVCFPSGPAGLAFGAGAIHAYLAADRKPPQLAAGVFLGTIGAAAMQRSFCELEQVEAQSAPAEQDLEARRWRWYRRFVDALTDRPWDAIWRALPDRSDFFARFTTLMDPATPAGVKDAERKAARRRDKLVLLGRWVAQLPLTVAELGTILRDFVLRKERLHQKRLATSASAATGVEPVPGFIWLTVRLWWVLERLAVFVTWEWMARFLANIRAPNRRSPIFGRTIQSIAALIAISHSLLVADLAMGVYFLRYAPDRWPWSRLLTLFAFWAAFRTILLLPSVSALRPRAATVEPAARSSDRLLRIRTWLTRKIRTWLTRTVKRALELDKSLLDDFYLCQQLEQLFGDYADPASRKSYQKATTGGPPFPVLLVAAGLQPLSYSHQGRVRLDWQLVAPPSAPLVEALSAALRPVAPSRLFEPARVTRAHPQQGAEWIPKNAKLPNNLDRLDLVSGTLLGQNPLPALFRYFREDSTGRTIAKTLERPSVLGQTRHRRSIHVLYDVPLSDTLAEPAENQTPDPRKPASTLNSTREPDALNIVDVGIRSIQLARRRDTQLEVQLANFFSRIERAARAAAATHPPEHLLQVFADEIAPDRELQFGNPLDPTPHETLERIADGCRRTLEVLYSDTIRDLSSSYPSEANGVESYRLPCLKLIQTIGLRRGEATKVFPGRPEVCSRCSRELVVPIEGPRSKPVSSKPLRLEVPERIRDFPPNLLELLSGQRPRIVFVASGGVFRGAFHVGLIGAMKATGIRPDLIVGSSVGTLLGGALAGLLAEQDDEKRSKRLGRLVDAFIEVDRKVALTRRFQRAARELGTRATKIRLSPGQVRQAVLGGLKSDTGFLSGAPSSLIDCLSTLLLIPHKQTTDLAAEFIAGHAPQAAALLWTALKTDSLRRLGIEKAIIDRTLLERLAALLLEPGPGHHEYPRQPFASAKIAFLSTATNLSTKKVESLGLATPYPGAPFNFVKAALASSAFPTVFAPVRESDIYPGVGRYEVAFGDGGLFDNLPFLPAIELLADCQRAHRASNPQLNAWEFLRRRSYRPDLFIVGALDVDLEEQLLAPAKPSRSQGKSRSRASNATRAYSANYKIRSFQSSSRLLHRQVKRILAPGQPDEAWLSRHYKLLDGVVDGAVLPIFPSDEHHLNGTFHFCASLGLDSRRVARSIADGCFRTLHKLATIQDQPGDILAHTLRGLRKERLKSSPLDSEFLDIPRVPKVRRRTDHATTGTSTMAHYCPFFEKTELTFSAIENNQYERFDCPFLQLPEPHRKNGSAIFEHCKGDASHLSAIAA